MADGDNAAIAVLITLVAGYVCPGNEFSQGLGRLETTEPGDALALARLLALRRIDTVATVTLA